MRMARAVRRPPGRPPIPRARFVATALQILDEEGSEVLSLRTLAQRLNSSTATLYRHFANRAELIADVIDSILGEVPLDAQDAPAAGWQQQCRQLSTSMFAALARHPNVAPLLAHHVPVRPHAMAHREACLRVLLDAGFPSAVAARSYATLARYVLGFSIQLDADTQSEAERQVAATFRTADPAVFPATVAAAEFLPVRPQDEFTFGLELILT